MRQCKEELVSGVSGPSNKYKYYGGDCLAAG